MRKIIQDGLLAWLITDAILIIGATCLYLSTLLPQPIGATMVFTAITFAAASIGLTVFTLFNVYVAIAAQKCGAK